MGEKPQFRGIQKQVIRAIIRGKSPIIQVTGTGGGKSLLFMLPAFCAPDGVSIVVVPLVALYKDLHRRCQESGIDSHIWQSRSGNRAASIILMTPESAVTKGFQLFVNRLHARGQLYRVVIDECHAVLDSERAFRPQMGKLGSVLRGFGVQVVFLTATLAPGDVAEFTSRIKLQGQKVCFYRQRTTRQNVGYRVKVVAKGEDEDTEVCRTVEKALERYESGKVMVYSGLIGRGKRLGELLSCPVYYSSVDTAEGKARRVREWVSGGRVIVTTNALGMGIDIPDVRVVVQSAPGID
ncbi:P-loop containing nucleoside triphosphate hydrolase protein [Apiosordaria backusii]|uniref:DNA 3'-5' helicase n=1 Tax=Apiosordaria backusii TaxID=314023 RepID=A0AA40K3J2_9PEZI|nr:P-loop containing nucleoside triphosphate hydrolase protein [Apiosordaria backusii]